MKNQALFSSKDKSKKLKCRLLQLLFSALRVKTLSTLSIFDLEDMMSETAMFKYSNTCNFLIF